MRILVVEDEAHYLVDLLGELGTIVGLEVSLAMSATSALEELETGESFDLVLCDLMIPTQDMSLDKDPSHGLRVVAEIQRLCPGTPIIVHSGWADRFVTQELQENARREDFLGRGEDELLVRMIHKREIADAVARIEQLATEFAVLNAIRINTPEPPVPMSRDERRALRIYARRHGGTLVQARELGGGFSASRVLEIEVQDETGGIQAQVVAKLADLQLISDEHRRFRRYVGPQLGIGACASILEVVCAGAGSTGALFYQVARDSASLFNILVADPERAGNLVEVLHEQLGQWHQQGRPMETVTVEEIRSRLTGAAREDDALPEDFDLGDLETFEAQTAQVRPCFQHRDLHGDNVLISDGNPILIDFGECGDAIASLDPVTLELSTLFHPRAAVLIAEWPTLEQLERWYDLDQYVVGCPIEAFVRACRGWAYRVAGNNQAVAANAYAYACRQLRYEDTEKVRAAALIKGAIAAWDVL